MFNLMKLCLEKNLLTGLLIMLLFYFFVLFETLEATRICAMTDPLSQYLEKTGKYYAVAVVVVAPLPSVL